MEGGSRCLAEAVSWRALDAAVAELDAPLRRVQQTDRALPVTAQRRDPDAVAAPTSRRVTVALVGVAALLALAQIAAMLAVADGDTFGTRYQALCQWDCGWYARIVADGYWHYDLPTNGFQPERSDVAFFPGYPLAARLTQRMTGLSTTGALLVTAQLAAWGFWSYFLVVQRAWRVPPWGMVAAVVAVLAHPGAFFFVVAYAEAPMLAAALGLLHGVARRGPRSALLAGLHGALATATRPLGVAALAFPVACLGELPLRRLVTIALLTVSGGLGFLAYCQWAFGAWDLYARVAAAGWGDRWMWDAVLDWRSYYAAPRAFRAAWAGDAGALSRVAIDLATRGLLVLVAVDLIAGAWRRRLPARVRLGLYAAAAVTLQVTVGGRASLGMSGALRYIVAAHVFLVLAAVHLAQEVPDRSLRWARIGLLVVVAAWAVVGGLVELRAAHRFVHEQWVA